MAITHQQALEHLHAWSCDDASAKGMSDEQSNMCRDIVLEHVAKIEAENARLRIAFHDATRRPLGVTPDSGAEFYDPRMADEAEERRAEMTQKDRERRSDETWHYLM